MALARPGTKLYFSPCVKPMAKVMTLIISPLLVEQLHDCYFTLMATTCFLTIADGTTVRKLTVGSEGTVPGSVWLLAHASSGPIV